MTTLFLFVLYACTPVEQQPAPRGAFADTSQPVVRAAAVAHAAGVDSVFLERVITSKHARFHDKAARINVTNFATHPDYSHNHDQKSVRTLRTWIAANDKVLSQWSKKYTVSKEVISSIIWVETKCGNQLGIYHVPSVYLSLALCNERSFIDNSVDAVMKNASIDSTKRDSIYALIVRRADKKATWAISQLKSLDTIHKSGRMNVVDLKGSWAGAFGLTQFIPSSYRKFARDGNSDGMIDLYNTADAVASVANYLHDNGWGKTLKSQRAAVFHYNNSDAYVDAVLTLADKVREAPPKPRKATVRRRHRRR